jgi:hypothetical protein
MKYYPKQQSKQRKYTQDNEWSWKTFERKTMGSASIKETIAIEDIYINREILFKAMASL